MDAKELERSFYAHRMRPDHRINKCPVCCPESTISLINQISRKNRSIYLCDKCFMHTSTKLVTIYACIVCHDNIIICNKCMSGTVPLLGNLSLIGDEKIKINLYYMDKVLEFEAEDCICLECGKKYSALQSS